MTKFDSTQLLFPKDLARSLVRFHFLFLLGGWLDAGSTLAFQYSPDTNEASQPKMQRQNDRMNEPENKDDEIDSNYSGNDDDAGENGDAESDGIYINVPVPSDAEPGVDSLTFEYGGNTFEVLVPLGSSSGDVLRIQVGTAAGFDADDRACGSKDDVGRENDEEEVGLLGEMGGMIDEEESHPAVKKSPERKQSLKHASQSHNGISIVPLGDGLNPQIYSKIGNNVQTIEPKTEIESNNRQNQSIMTLNLLESLPCTGKSTHATVKEGDGTHAMVWPSGKVLAQTLTSKSGIDFLKKNLLGRSGSEDDFSKQSAEEGAGKMEFTRKKHVNCLELGSGLGVCGLALAFALVSCSISESTHASSGVNNDGEGVDVKIMLTDQGQEAKQILSENIQRNVPLSITTNNDVHVSITAETLTWGDSNTSIDTSNMKFHVILGSDLLYNTQESYEPLLSTIKKYLHPEKGIFLLAVRWRKPLEERDFFQKAAQIGLEFELCKEFTQDATYIKRCPSLLSWREYGNPACESSNTFFHDTDVTISQNKGGDKKQKAVTKSLAECTEMDMEQMSDVEYSFFEELQIQILVGRFDVKGISHREDDMKSRKRQKNQTSCQNTE